MSNHPRLFMRHLTIFILATSFSLCYANEASYTQPSYLDEHKPTTDAPTTTASQSQSAKQNDQLQIELSRYQAALQKPWPILLEHKRYRIGKKYDDVPELRDRLEITGDLNPSDTLDKNLFDDALVVAIQRFQTRHGLKSDGVVGKLTIAELNVLPAARIKAIQLNIQRWALLSKQLGERYILVNIPDYQLYLFEDGQQVLTMKAIVGKPTLQTPELASRITRVVFNPYWNVPDKIAAKDLAPKVKEDPYYLSDMHIRVFVRNSEHSREVDSSQIDWENVQSNDMPYDFRQEPGDDNALGQVKFEFPNPYDVYLHDTAAKDLFNLEIRDLSHGCVRLERPLDLVSYLMKDSPNWSEELTQSILDSRKTKAVSVAKPIPIYITYITVWTDENGMVNYRDDIYQRDI